MSAMQAQHLAMPAHPLAAPQTATYAPKTHGGMVQHASPMTPAGTRPAAPPPPLTPQVPQVPQVPVPQVPQADPEKMAAEFLGRSVAKRTVIQASQVSQDVAGLRLLAAARSWRALLQLAQQLLAGKTLTPPPSAVSATAAAPAGDSKLDAAKAKLDTARALYLEIAAFRIAGLLQIRNVRYAKCVSIHTKNVSYFSPFQRRSLCRSLCMYIGLI